MAPSISLICAQGGLSVRNMLKEKVKLAQWEQHGCILHLLLLLRHLSSKSNSLQFKQLKDFPTRYIYERVDIYIKVVCVESWFEYIIRFESWWAENAWKNHNSRAMSSVGENCVFWCCIIFWCLLHLVIFQLVLKIQLCWGIFVQFCIVLRHFSP